MSVKWVTAGNIFQGPLFTKSSLVSIALISCVLNLSYFRDIFNFQEQPEIARRQDIYWHSPIRLTAKVLTEVCLNVHHLKLAVFRSFCQNLIYSCLICPSFGTKQMRQPHFFKALYRIFKKRFSDHYHGHRCNKVMEHKSINCSRKLQISAKPCSRS